MDGKISDDEIPDFALISTRLDEISTASDVLRLWIEKNNPSKQTKWNIIL